MRSWTWIYFFCTTVHVCCFTHHWYLAIFLLSKFLQLTVASHSPHVESSLQLKEERITVDKDEKSALPKGTSTSQNRDEVKFPGLKQKIVHAVHGVEVSTSKKSKLRTESVNDTNLLFESKEKLPSAADRTWKRKRKSMISKVNRIYYF